MRRIVCIVEGHGEVLALPLLLRRIVLAIDPSRTVDIPQPIRVGRHRLLKPGELERATELAARQCEHSDTILLLLDADDDCPVTLSRELAERARAARADRNVDVVIANREYEAWFLAAAASLAGRRGLPTGCSRPDAPEEVRDAKGWLSVRMGGRRYGETTDQPAFSDILDLNEARTAPSFDKLWRTVGAAISR